MNRHRYPAGSLKGDYIRAGIGLLITAIPLSAGLGLIAGAIFGGLAALFLGFGLRTLARQCTVVFVAPEGIATELLLFSAPLRRSLRWAEIEDVNLRFFSTERSRSSGWMELTVKGAGTRLKIDSDLEGFETIAKTVADAAERNGLQLDPMTAENLVGLGLPRPPGLPDRRW